MVYGYLPILASFKDNVCRLELNLGKKLLTLMILIHISKTGYEK